MWFCFIFPFMVASKVGNKREGEGGCSSGKGWEKEDWGCEGGS